MTVLSATQRTKKCKECGKDFLSFNTVQKYCSLDCAKISRHIQTVSKTKSAEKRNKVLFKKKYGEKVGKVSLLCAVCKNPYDRYASQVKFRGSTYCSVTCKGVAQLKSKTRTQLVKGLDVAYSRYIREKYSINGMVSCVTCNKVDELRHMQNGHFMSRRYYSTRWLDKNCHPQCYGCNVGLSGNYARYSLFMIDTYGLDVLQELIDLSTQPSELTKLELQEKIDYYKGLLK